MPRYRRGQTGASSLVGSCPCLLFVSVLAQAEDRTAVSDNFGVNNAFSGVSFSGVGVIVVGCSCANITGEQLYRLGARSLCYC